MSISIFQQAGRLDYMIVTRTDSAQVTKDLKIKLNLGSPEKALADESAPVFSILLVNKSMVVMNELR